MNAIVRNILFPVNYLPYAINGFDLCEDSVDLYKLHLVRVNEIVPLAVDSHRYGTSGTQTKVRLAIHILV